MVHGVFGGWNRPRTTYNYTVNYNQGPHCHGPHGGSGSFWGGFTGGLLGGLFSGLGSFFGGFGNFGMFNSFGNFGMWGNPYGYLNNNAGAQPKDEFASLKGLFPDHEFTKVGKLYVATDKDGNKVDAESIEQLYGKLEQAGNEKVVSQKAELEALEAKRTKAKSDLLKLSGQTTVPEDGIFTINDQRVKVDADGNYQLINSDDSPCGSAITSLEELIEELHITDGTDGKEEVVRTEEEEATDPSKTTQKTTKATTTAASVTTATSSKRKTQDKGTTTQTANEGIELTNEQITLALKKAGMLSNKNIKVDLEAKTVTYKGGNGQEISTKITDKSLEEAIRMTQDHNIAASIKKQLTEHDWSPNDGTKLLDQITPDNVLTVLQDYDGEIIKDTDNVFGLNKRDAYVKVIRPLLKKYPSIKAPTQEQFYSQMSVKEIQTWLNETVKELSKTEE